MPSKPDQIRAQPLNQLGQRPASGITRLSGASVSEDRSTTDPTACGEVKRPWLPPGFEHDRLEHNGSDSIWGSVRAVACCMRCALLEP